MIDMLSVGSVKSDGLPMQEFKRLRPWEVAVKLLPIENEQTVDVEHATDQQFQKFVTSIGLPVDDAGIPEWSFDDRCRAINHALRYGLWVSFADEGNNSDKESKELPKELDAELIDELFGGDEMPTEDSSQDTQHRELPTGMPSTSKTPTKDFLIDFANAAMLDMQRPPKRQCERCDQLRVLTTIETIEDVEPHQEGRVCDECLAIVVTGRNVWRVKP